MIVCMLRVSGPTMKLKRQVVTKMYENEIDSLYTDAGGPWCLHRSSCFRNWSPAVTSSGTDVVNEAMIWIAVHSLQYSMNIN